MKHGILLTTLLLLLAGCQKESPELARKVPTPEEEVEDNETNAISSVKKLVNAQFDYSEGSGRDYAMTLVDLQSRGLIDSALESGVKDGYVFSMGSSGSAFTVGARPMIYDSTGVRSFFSDESGVIRYTREERPATADDPPLTQGRFSISQEATRRK
jgi:hypothetical protein